MDGFSPIEYQCICTAITYSGKRCANKAKFVNNINNEKIVCSLHTKDLIPKNTLHDRRGSFRYAVHKTLQHKNTPTSSNVLCNDDTSTCFYCKKNFSEHKLKRSIDHIFNLINKGGEPTQRMVESQHNKVLCCSICNSSKGNGDAITWANTQHLSETTINSIIERKKHVLVFDDDTYKEKLLLPYNLSMCLYESLNNYLSKSNPIEIFFRHIVKDFINVTNISKQTMINIIETLP